jgi:hypothetical protein
LARSDVALADQKSTMNVFSLHKLAQGAAGQRITRAVAANSIQQSFNTCLADRPVTLIAFVVAARAESGWIHGFD